MSRKINLNRLSQLANFTGGVDNFVEVLPEETRTAKAKRKAAEYYGTAKAKASELAAKGKEKAAMLAEKGKKGLMAAKDVIARNKVKSGLAALGLLAAGGGAAAAVRGMDINKPENRKLKKFLVAEERRQKRGRK